MWSSDYLHTSHLGSLLEYIFLTYGIQVSGDRSQETAFLAGTLGGSLVTQI